MNCVRANINAFIESLCNSCKNCSRTSWKDKGVSTVNKVLWTVSLSLLMSTFSRAQLKYFVSSHKPVEDTNANEVWCLRTQLLVVTDYCPSHLTSCKVE